MNEEFREKVKETYARKLAELQGKPTAAKVPKVNEMQGLLGIDVSLPDFSGDFCSDAQNSINYAQKFIKQWAMFIPDKYEKPLLAFFATCEDALLPVVCGAADEAVTVAKAEVGAAKTNFGPKKG